MNGLRFDEGGQARACFLLYSINRPDPLPLETEGVATRNPVAHKAAGVSPFTEPAPLRQPQLLVKNVLKRILLISIIRNMKRKHAKTLALVFHRPVSANVKFCEAVSLLVELGAAIETNREGSRVGVVVFGEVRVLHKPHPSPNMDKGAVAALRDWLEQKGVTP